MQEFSALVTGATGFIGQHLVRYLCGQGYRVVATRRSPGADVFEDLGSQVDLFTWDVTDGAPALPRCRSWFHLAANTNTGYCNEHPDRANAINALSLKNVLGTAEKTGCEVFVLAGTLGVYGDPVYLPTDEAHPKQPIEAYAVSKANAEAQLLAFQTSKIRSRVVARLFNTYGPGQGSWMLIPKLIDMAIEFGRVDVQNTDCTRDFIFVADVVRGLTACAHLAEDGDIINLGTGVETSVKALVELLGTVTGRQLEVDVIPAASGRPVVRRSQADIRKAGSVLQWVPRISLSEGLGLTVQHHLAKAE
jgi:UDP-glucose 4-epimerase